MNSRIPKFRSINEERAFWQTHSATDYWDELTPVKLKFVSAQKKPVSVELSGLEVRVLQGILTRLVRHRPSPLTHRSTKS